MTAPAPLNAVRAFEAVARNGTYARAGKELHVTAAAVGQQVRALEASLGIPLFRRLEAGATRLVLTEDAKLAADEFRAGLDAVERGLRRLRRRSGDALTITASQAFVAKWLMPRLEGFTSAHPTVAVRLDVSDPLLDLGRGDADVGVRCGDGHWPGLVVTRLMGEEIFPVGAPSLVRKRERAARMDLGDARRFTLLHDLMQEGTGAFPSWETWLTRAGMNRSPGRAGLRINSSSSVIQAAIAGHGIALARSALVQDDLARGLLVRLGPRVSFPVSWAYYVVRSADAASRAPVRAFCAWIVCAMVSERPMRP